MKSIHDFGEDHDLLAVRGKQAKVRNLDGNVSEEY